MERWKGSLEGISWVQKNPQATYSRLFQARKARKINEIRQSRSQFLSSADFLQKFGLWECNSGGRKRGARSLEYRVRNYCLNLPLNRNLRCISCIDKLFASNKQHSTSRFHVPDLLDYHRCCNVVNQLVYEASLETNISCSAEIIYSKHLHKFARLSRGGNSTYHLMGTCRFARKIGTHNSVNPGGF